MFRVGVDLFPCSRVSIKDAIIVHFIARLFCLYSGSVE